MSVPCFFCTYWQPVEKNENNTYDDVAAMCVYDSGSYLCVKDDFGRRQW
jgi:hypothetical protein